MDPVLMKFKIHSDLKQFEKAVKKLSQGDKDATDGALKEKYFNEVLVFIKKNRLYKQALEFYSHNEDCTKQIKLAFGEYLEQRSYSEEAGFLYSAAGETDLGL